MELARLHHRAQQRARHWLNSRSWDPAERQFIQSVVDEPSHLSTSSSHLPRSRSIHRSRSFRRLPSRRRSSKPRRRRRTGGGRGRKEPTPCQIGWKECVAKRNELRRMGQKLADWGGCGPQRCDERGFYAAPIMGHPLTRTIVCRHPWTGQPIESTRLPKRQPLDCSAIRARLIRESHRHGGRGRKQVGEIPNPWLGYGRSNQAPSSLAIKWWAGDEPSLDLTVRELTMFFSFHKLEYIKPVDGGTKITSEFVAHGQPRKDVTRSMREERWTRFLYLYTKESDTQPRVRIELVKWTDHIIVSIHTGDDDMSMNIPGIKQADQIAAIWDQEMEHDDPYMSKGTVTRNDRATLNQLETFQALIRSQTHSVASKDE